MTNIVYVDFQKQKEICEREAFLTLLSIELDELDFAEFVDAVNDPVYYTTVEPDIQDFVDTFFACRA